MPNVNWPINDCCKAIGQTFTAGVGGTLAGVQVDIRGDALPLQIAIHRVESGLPTTTVLTSTTLSTGTSTIAEMIAFPDQPLMVAGAMYAIVASYPSAPALNYGWGVWSAGGGNPYPRGTVVFLDGSTWKAVDPTNLTFSSDLQFQTYVRPTR